VPTIADSIEQLDCALTVPQLAQLLNVNRIILYRQIQAGILPAFRVGSCVRLDPKRVAQWLRQRG
jgi:excisionase family DNA binding protein